MGPPPVPRFPPMQILLFLFAAPLALLPAQDPTSPPRAAVPAEASASTFRDRIELTSGEVLVGKIVQEVGNYVEIELQPGCVVGFRTAQVASIRRNEAQDPAATPNKQPARDEWFLLHDGTGLAIGTLHLTVATDGKGVTQALEEWDFVQGKTTCQVTSIARMDAAGNPLDCYFRERMLENAQIGSPLDPMATQTRVENERIVQAHVDGGSLVVTRLEPKKRSERTIPWQQGATFALLARELPSPSRRGEIAVVTVFDPASEDLRIVSFGAARPRLVAIDGAHRVVEESVEQSADGRNTIWRDAATGSLRREVAGPALVAVRCDAQSAKNLVGVRRVASPFVADMTRSFGLWLPNPSWSVAPSEPGLVLRMPMHEASISLSRLDSLDAQSALESAAAAVERWSALAYPKFAVTARAERSLRGARAMQIETSAGLGNDERRARIVVVAGDDGFLVLRCAAPARAWDELEADFEAAATRLERTASAVAALDGKRAEATATPAASVPQPVAAAAPLVESSAIDPSVAPILPVDEPKQAKGRVLVPPQDGDKR